jgi:hypothetical protein
MSGLDGRDRMRRKGIIEHQIRVSRQSSELSTQFGRLDRKPGTRYTLWNEVNRELLDE